MRQSRPAPGEVLHNDDTPAKILALMGKRAEPNTADGQTFEFDVGQGEPERFSIAIM